MRYGALVAAALLPAAGCSSIIEGTSQEIQVNTFPAGASCTFLRKGQPTATISPTPGSALVKKTKDKITIVCDKPGYSRVTLADQSGMAAAAAADVLLPVVGSALDSASGADNKYDSPVNLTLAQETAPQAGQTQAATPAAQTPAAMPAQPIYYLVYPSAAGQTPQGAMPVAPPGYALVLLPPGAVPGGAAAQMPVAAAAGVPVVLPASYVTAPQPVAAPAGVKAVVSSAPAVQPVTVTAAAPAVAAKPAAQVQMASGPLYPVDVHTGTGGQVMHLQTGYLQVPAASGEAR
jgi:hypothetical protein